MLPLAILLSLGIFQYSFGSEDNCFANSTRLVEGNNNSSGRVEVCHNGQWGTVCGNNFGIINGFIICKQLGFRGAWMVTKKFGPGTGPIWLDNHICEGDESSLLACPRSNSSTFKCTHNQDIGVMCITPDYPDRCISNQNEQVCFWGVWGTVCKDSQFKVIDEQVHCERLGIIVILTSISLECTNRFCSSEDRIIPMHCDGTVSSLFHCTAYAVYYFNCSQHYGRTICIPYNQCIDNSVRLVGGSSNYTGTIEVCRYGTYGAVCDDAEFGLTEGDVVCKQLGFNSAMGLVRNSEPVLGRHILLNNLNCSGTESSLYECSRTLFWKPCVTGRIVGVTCGPRTIADICEPGSIRLYNMTVAGEGRVQLCVNKLWNYVSSENFDVNDGRVACRQLGYDEIDGYPTNDYVSNRKIVIISQFSASHGCTGNESSLYDCYSHALLTKSGTDIIRIKCFNHILMLSKSSTIVLHSNQTEVTVNFTCISSITDPIKWTWKFENMVILESDDRYRMTHQTTVSPNVTMSTLQIIDPRKSDEGRYDCSIGYTNIEAAQAHNVSQANYLELEAELYGSISVENNITTSLSCELTGYVLSDTVIEWFRDNDRIQTIRDKYFITVSKGNNVLVNGEGKVVQSTISTLFLYTTDIAGNYECAVLADFDYLYLNFTLYNQSLPLVDDHTLSTSYTTLIAGTIATSGFVVLIILILICCGSIVQCVRQRRKERHDVFVTQTHQYITMKGLNKTDIQREKLNAGILSNVIIDPSDLKVMEIVGQGSFGVVYRGILKTELICVESVAIKTVKGSYSESQVDQLLKEAEIMKSFDHLHVLSLTGICVGLLESPCIVMPFMSNGSLLSYLRREANDITINEMADENVCNSVLKHLLSICLQVAKGMNYLSQQKFIHRDLAARNCMISSEGIIKICDFGLAEDVYTTIYFKESSISDEKFVRLPLKWMALESIHLGKFDEKTDVWSYGVLCWEVFNGGKIPYPGSTPKEVVTMLDNGERLTKPTNAACTDEVYSIMLSCWESSAECRPHFHELVENINNFLIPLADYMDMTPA